jgi:cell division protein FtsB
MKVRDSFLNSFLNYWVLLAIFLLIVGIIRGEGGTDSYMALAKSRDRLKDTVSKLRKETDELEEEILKIKTSKEYAKKIYKDKYHATKSGEIIVFFAD